MCICLNKHNLFFFLTANPFIVVQDLRSVILAGFSFDYNLQRGKNNHYFFFLLLNKVHKKEMRGLYSLTALVVSCVTLLSSVVEAKSSTGSRVLVLLDSLAEKESYNHFWHQLQGTKNKKQKKNSRLHSKYTYIFKTNLDRQFELIFKKADDPSITLLYFGESLYNHIIHFAPKTDSKYKPYEYIHIHAYIYSFICK